MKVLILGSEKNFSKSTGSGISTFSDELLLRLAKYVSITKLEHKNSVSINNIYINKFVRSNHFDIIHDLEGASAVKISKSSRKKFITHVHDIDILLFDKSILFKKPSINNYIWFSINKKSLIQKLKDSAAIIAVSNQLKELLIDFCGVEKQKLFVVNHGVSDEFKPLKVRPTKFIIGTLSNMSPRKNPVMLLNAFKLFNDMLNIREQNEIELELYGNIDNQTFKLINNEIKGYKNIKIGGFLNPNKKVIFYNSLSIFAYPSIEEAFGLPILEAQACGIPTVINGNGIFSEEVIKKSIKAYNYEHMADIFYKIFSSGIKPTDKASYIRYAKSFTWEKAANRTLDIYKYVVDNK